ncbi:MAG TPA: nucleotidyl transferase AbiEii/AbiGii toxin family protein [Jatrophihabitans sp.]
MITEGFLVRHYQGASGARDAALLDVAQDHLLLHLHAEGLFDRGVVFKGGTALRKFRAGNLGRFSTDLDFSAPDEALALDVLSAVDGAEIFGFRFAVERLGDDGRRGDIVVDSPIGRPNLGAKIELSRHALVLPPEHLAPIPLPIHRSYDFTLPELPVVRAEEAIAEKLARFRRVSLARDLYDLQWFVTQGSLDKDLVRRLWVLKVYRDVNHDGRGDKPLSAEQVLRPRTAHEFAREDTGYLTKPIAVSEWIETVRDRYGFLRDMTDDEQRWALCNARHDWEVSQAMKALGRRYC